MDGLAPGFILQTSSTQPAEAKHAVVRGVTSDDEDTVGTMSTRASSRANESRPVR